MLPLARDYFSISVFGIFTLSPGIILYLCHLKIFASLHPTQPAHELLSFWVMQVFYYAKFLRMIDFSHGLVKFPIVLGPSLRFYKLHLWVSNFYNNLASFLFYPPLWYG